MNQYNPYTNHQPVKVVGPPNCPPPINEPTLGGKLEESLMRTHDLDHVLCVLAERIFGYSEAQGVQEAKAEAKAEPYQPSLTEMATNLSERMAQCVGLCRTILQKIGEGH
jgi:hypothetical protein